MKVKDNNNLLIVVGVAIVVAIIVSVIVVNVTGNIIKVNPVSKDTEQVYTKFDVDNLFGKLYVTGGSCIYWAGNNIPGGPWLNTDMCGLNTNKSFCDLKANNGKYIKCLQCRYNNSTKTSECLKEFPGV